MDDQLTTTVGSPPGRGHDFFVVGIGASAGGISALRQFFSRIPPDIGMAFVVILHMSPQHESNLPALLQNQTELQVTQVTEAVRVEPNHVYVIPPTKYLVMVDGKIHLTEPELPRGGHTSIDLFFRTLANAYGRDAMVILLSGTGTDGAMGIGRIKEEGGFVIVQEPSEAEYPDMPRAGIDTGLVDLVMPVAEMPSKLRALRDRPQLLQTETEREQLPPAGDQGTALREILTLVRLRTGNDFSQYKRPTLLRRIARRMQVHDIGELPAYLALLRENPDEIAALLQDLLITVTNFFRDHESFEYLEKEIIPRIFQGKGRDDEVRVWSAGCATGEEAYSLAILLAEYAATIPDAPKIQVFATDIDEKAVAIARACRYLPSIALDVSPQRLEHFFVNEKDHYQVRKDLREMVLLASHNVLRDPPFSRLDLISCRNLLIYLNREMQERLLGIFHFALTEGGYLFLGGSETADQAPTLFEAADKRQRVYVRRPVVSSIQPSTDVPLRDGLQVKMREGTVPGDEGRRTAGELHHEAVEMLAPPSVLIDEEYDLIHVSANAGRFLRVAPGEPTRDLLKLIHPDLRLDLRTVLLEAKTRGGRRASTSRRVQLELDGETVTLNMTARPVFRPPQAAPSFFLVVFDQAAEPLAPVPDRARDNVNLEVVSQLEQDLQRTKDQLRITIEQYETSTEELRASNEELQAINEELRSATEELETSKEELQSVNEELTTVNQEYKEKIEEVGRANSDLQNLMASTDIGTIFLDRALQIKRYTPPVQQLFNITPADIGRPLEHFTHKLDYVSLTNDADEVLRTLHTAEREIHGFDDHWYLVRLVPYRTLDDKIDGVVLTFVNITNRKHDEEQVRRQAAMLREQAEVLDLADVFARDREDRIVLWNAGCERLYGYSREEAIGRNAHELLKTEFAEPLSEINAHLAQAGEWKGELVHTTRAGNRIVVASHWVLCRRVGDSRNTVLEVNNDITALRQAEKALREADLNRGRFLAALAHELSDPLSVIFSAIEAIERTESNTSETSRRAQAAIRRQLQRLIRLVDDSLDVERLRQGKITLSCKPVTLAEVIESTRELYQGAIDSKTHEFNVAMPSEPIYINADVVRLSRALANLVDNAFKYTPVGGRIDLTAGTSGSEVIIRLRDTGVGISGEMQPRVFEQREPAFGGETKGLSVGLALVRQIVELHQGSVEVFSQGTGKGSEFIVHLPIGASPEAE